MGESISVPWAVCFFALLQATTSSLISHSPPSSLSPLLSGTWNRAGCCLLRWYARKRCLLYYTFLVPRSQQSHATSVGGSHIPIYLPACRTFVGSPKVTTSHPPPWVSSTSATLRPSLQTLLQPLELTRRGPGPGVLPKHPRLPTTPDQALDNGSRLPGSTLSPWLPWAPSALVYTWLIQHPPAVFPVRLFPSIQTMREHSYLTQCSHLPRWRDCLPRVRIPSAQRNHPHLGRRADGLLHPLRRLPHCADPRPQLLGRQQRNNRTLVLPNHCSGVPGLYQVAHWRTPPALPRRLQTRYPR